SDLTSNDGFRDYGQLPIAAAEEPSVPVVIGRGMVSDNNDEKIISDDRNIELKLAEVQWVLQARNKQGDPVASVTMSLEPPPAAANQISIQMSRSTLDTAAVMDGIFVDGFAANSVPIGYFSNCDRFENSTMTFQELEAVTSCSSLFEAMRNYPRCQQCDSSCCHPASEDTAIIRRRSSAMDMNAAGAVHHHQMVSGMRRTAAVVQNGQWVLTQDRLYRSQRNVTGAELPDLIASWTLD
ncbi:unnamed protein product, partial [Notodromas monacha]